MTPETRKQYLDDLARVRYERDTYAKRAAERRKDAQAARRRRDWLGALQADDRASEYRKTRDQYAEEARRIQRILAA